MMHFPRAPVRTRCTSVHLANPVHPATLLSDPGQRDVEHRARLIARGDRAAVALDDRLDDREAEAAAAGGSRAVSAL